MRFVKAVVALLAVGAIAFGGSVAGTNYALDSREQAEADAQTEALEAQKRSTMVPGVDDSVEAAAQAPVVKNDLGGYTVRCQVHEESADGPLIGFLFGSHHEDAETAETAAKEFLSHIALGVESEVSHCRTWHDYVASGAFDPHGYRP